MSAAYLQELESGTPVSLETYARVATALELRPELLASDARTGQRARSRDQDFVHAAMGELEASRFRAHGFSVALDEPYQHYQFAGRADVVVWSAERGALLHIENRTAFPNVQEALGSYSAKRSYLAPVLADRLEIEGRRWLSVSHVVIALWSADVLRTLRLRTESFRTACPDPPETFLQWWAGAAPMAGGTTSSLLVFDPSGDLPDGRRFADLEDALRIRPRFRDYADAVDKLKV